MDGWPKKTFFHSFMHQDIFHQFYLGSTMEVGSILESNNTIAMDDCPPRTRETMELATNFTFWTEGIIQVYYFQVLTTFFRFTRFSRSRTYTQGTGKCEFSGLVQ